MPFRLARVVMVLLVVAGFAAPGQAAELHGLLSYEPDPPAGDEDALMSRYGFQPDQVGYLLQDLDSGKLLAAHSDARAFMPASVAKIPTAVAALQILGANHRFRTRVKATGPIVGDRLQGNLVLVGGGDPMLGTDALLALCHDLRLAGIRHVEGRFLYDAALAQARPALNPDQPPDAPYNPGISALSLDFNRVRVEWRPQDGTGYSTVYSVPSLPGIAFEMASAPPDPGQIWSPRTQGKDTFWQLSPDASREGEDWLPVRKPARFTAEVFRRLCGQLGIAIPAPETGAAGEAAWTLSEYESPPLHRLVQAMLAHSNNLVAELIGLAASRALSAEVADLPESADALARWWRAELPQVDWDGFVLDNHSGLSSRTMVTPAQIAAILAYGDDRLGGEAGGLGHTLASLLPASGRGGGLNGRLREPDTALRVWAKTGTINYASALAGYLYSDGGRRLAFVIFVNDRSARAAYDADPARRSPASRAVARAWRDRAKRLDAALVTRWVHEY